MKSDVPANYRDIVTTLKDKIQKARIQASIKLNADLLSIYWEIGATIARQEKESGWGAKIIVKLSADLQSGFPDMRGLSPRNLRYMRDFSLAYPEFGILQGRLAKMSWYHHITLLDKVKERDLEDALASQMTRVLQELGPYFGFLGRQHRVVLGEKEA